MAKTKTRAKAKAASALEPQVQVVGVGIDTARYGHHVSFLVPDDQAGVRVVAPAFRFEESQAGYAKLQHALDKLRERCPNARLFVRLDMAGQYGANLERFVRRLPVPISFSVGDPVRNEGYRVAHAPKRKSDPAESLAVARFAALERPRPADEVTPQMAELRELAARLLAVSRRQTRHANQLHDVLARIFPELPPRIGNLRKPTALRLLQRFPTPAAILKAKPEPLAKIPYLSAEKLAAVTHAARQTVGTFAGPAAELLVRGLADSLQQDAKEMRLLQKTIGKAYAALPKTNHVATVSGIGVVTAAAITAKTVDIARFASVDHLVGYFGLFPERGQSGVDPDGAIRGQRHGRMFRKGNDLVRAYLYNCARSAVRRNPACKELYARLKSKGKPSNVAFGHVMAKLLRQAYAVWKTDRPFERDYRRASQRKGDAAGLTPDLPDR